MPTTAPADLHLEIDERLAESGNRYTQGRRRLVELLASSGRPLTIPELLDLDKGLTQSSTYRNLDVLESCDVVRRLVHAGDHARFELAEEFSSHHHHLVCGNCGEVTDIELSSEVELTIERALQRAARAHGFVAERHAVDLYGLCGTCA